MPFALNTVLRPAALVLGLTALSACMDATSGPVQQSVPEASNVTQSTGAGISRSAFQAVVNRMEPITEADCRARTEGMNCDYKVVLDTDPKAPANAYQSLDRDGRPVLTFTAALLDDVRNVDEMAFIFGHEAAHHIRGHIGRAQSSAMMGGLLGVVVAVAVGGDATTIDMASNIGSTVGALRYSKDYELQADELGTILAHRGGYDPVRGAAYFARVPDPGDKFLGSHPPNAQRIDIVRRTAAAL